MHGGGPGRLNEFSVLRMDCTKECFVGEGCSAGYSKYSKHFIRPGEPISNDIQMPTSNVRNLLGLIQIRLTLSQCLFDPFALSHVAGGREHPDNLPGFIPIYGSVVDHRGEAALSMTDFQLVVLDLAFAEDLLVPRPSFLRLGEVIREVRADKLLLGESGHALSGAVDVRDLAVRRDGDQGIQAGLNQAAVIVARAAQRPLGLLTLGNVAGDRGGADHRTAQILDGRHTDGHVP